MVKQSPVHGLRQISELCQCLNRVPADSNSGHLRPFKDFLKPELSKCNTNVIQTNQLPLNGEATNAMF